MKKIFPCENCNHWVPGIECSIRNEYWNCEVYDYSIKINAYDYWNKAFKVYKGNTYLLTATGKWKDWYIETDANGFNKWWLQLTKFLLRYPNANWFTLIGTIDKKDPFIIGSQTTYTAKKDGYLYCYANDIFGYYFNNLGSITLKLKELK